MPKVSNLKIALQTGSDNTYFASWDFNQTTKNQPTSSGVKKGDLVTIKSGAKWYTGQSIPSWVMNDSWYVYQISGDRAVLNKNASGTHAIMSPINVKYLNGGSGSSSSSGESVSEDTVDHYEVYWYYATGDGISFDGGSSDVTLKNATYSPPDNAIKIKVKVKPIAKTYKVDDKEVSYWTGESTTYTLCILDLAPEKLNTPTVEVEDYTLTMSLENIEDNRADSVLFRVYDADTGNCYKSSGYIDVLLCAASYSCKLTVGAKYRVRCAGYNQASGELGPWSDYSSIVYTVPSAPSKITSLKATSETSINIQWEAVASAETYTIEYTTKKEYFDGSDAIQSVTGIETTKYEMTGIETGQEYFFRVKAVNDLGESGWSPIKSVVVGDEPTAPTTWSSTTTVVTGESLILYWVHNSKDGSSQTYAELEMYIDGVKQTQTIKNTTDEDEKDKTSSYTIDTSSYTEGTVIQWRVRTAGVTKTYGDWSVQRRVDVYAPATLQLNVTNAAGTDLDTITSFPFYIKGLAGPKTQEPIGYHVSITSNSIYETVDNVGNFKMVNSGEEVYSRYFDTSDPLLLEMTAYSIDLENGVDYTVTCTVSMNSGLTAVASDTFTVSWIDVAYEPDAEIGIDSENYSAIIRPYCLDADGNSVEGITLSVYRRDFDGNFTEIATGIDPTKNMYITDPHPSLDYARYRVIATTTSTGAISFYDVPGRPVGCTSVILQWDDVWRDFDAGTGDQLEQPIWSGSMLKLPYNIDVSENHQPDVELVEYIGRKHPVSYYGTQIGTSASWSMEIPKYDKETLFALRRLQTWMGDVYVREPSGSGYWANITVSFSQTHCELTIPVSLDITRVEGGV